jgi:hypothetical protein
MPVENLEQFHQRERRLGLPVLVARKGFGAAAEDRSGLPLVEASFLRTRAMNAGSTMLALPR